MPRLRDALGRFISSENNERSVIYYELPRRTGRTTSDYWWQMMYYGTFAQDRAQEESQPPTPKKIKEKSLEWWIRKELSVTDCKKFIFNLFIQNSDDNDFEELLEEVCGTFYAAFNELNWMATHEGHEYWNEIGIQVENQTYKK